MYESQYIRNVAIVAHIDHGKTTLIDSLLRFIHLFREGEVIPDRIMDSFMLERERGITIFAKHTALLFGPYKINMIDTPGHSDFFGEIERVLDLVNSVLLLVDAKEGPMPQTRFVLSYALKKGLRPIVVINKIDRPNADPERALNLTFDLFVELGASDQQLNFPYCYCSALRGFAKRTLTDSERDMKPLFEMIINNVPMPPGSKDNPFLMQATTLSYNEYTGRAATGRILDGTISKGDSVARVHGETGEISIHKVTLVEGYLGLKKISMPNAGAGDIVNISGIFDITIGDTLCHPDHIQKLSPIELGEPTLSIDLFVNSSPLAGKDGKFLTMNKLKERLEKEKRANISLIIEESKEREEAMRISGRGELHLAILMETMRREGFEFTLSKPKVIVKKIEGIIYEPFEIAYLEIKEEVSGSIIEELSKRKGELQFLHTTPHHVTQMEFLVPTRGIMGFRTDFMTMTKGEGILTSIFKDYYPFKGELVKKRNGSLVSNSKGKSTAYALFALQNRGTFYISPGEEVYEGMIVGSHNRDNDLIVNVTKEKHLTNIRAAGSDENIILSPPVPLTLESALYFMREDEWVEITPSSIRLRKSASTK